MSGSIGWEKGADAGGEGGELGGGEDLGVKRLLEKLLVEARRDRELREEEKRRHARELAAAREQHHASEAALREQLASRDEQILHLSGLVASLKTEIALGRGHVTAQTDLAAQVVSETTAAAGKVHKKRSARQDAGTYDV